MRACLRCTITELFSITFALVKYENVQAVLWRWWLLLSVLCSHRKVYNHLTLPTAAELEPTLLVVTERGLKICHPNLVHWSLEKIFLGSELNFRINQTCFTNTLSWFLKHLTRRLQKLSVLSNTVMKALQNAKRKCYSRSSSTIAGLVRPTSASKSQWAQFKVLLIRHVFAKKVSKQLLAKLFYSFKKIEYFCLSFTVLWLA